MNHTTTTHPTATRKHIWDTNFNGKLACAYFIHIDLAPSQPLPQSHLEAPVQIITRDDSHPPVLARLDDLARIPLGHLYRGYKWLTWCSHGLTGRQLALQLTTRYPHLQRDSEIAIYFYTKL
jgi:hypothetical protein